MSVISEEDNSDQQKTKKFNGYFTGVPEVVIDYYVPLIGIEGLAIYTILSRLVNNKKKYAFPSIRTLTKYCTMGNDTVYRALDALVKYGLISIISGGKGKNNRYYVYEPKLMDDVVNYDDDGNIVITNAWNDLQELGCPRLIKNGEQPEKGVPQSGTPNENKSGEFGEEVFPSQEQGVPQSGTVVFPSQERKQTDLPDRYNQDRQVGGILKKSKERTGGGTKGMEDILAEMPKGSPVPLSPTEILDLADLLFRRSKLRTETPRNPIDYDTAVSCITVDGAGYDYRQLLDFIMGIDDETKYPQKFIESCILKGRNVKRKA